MMGTRSPTGKATSQRDDRGEEEEGDGEEEEEEPNDGRCHRDGVGGLMKKQPRPPQPHPPVFVTNLAPH